MSESQGRDLKPPEDGMFYENFGFGTFFWYHNFQNEIDAWESTVHRFLVRGWYQVPGARSSKRCVESRSCQNSIF